ncbi:Vegetative incompatibility HET-E-1-like protein [Cladobotryum mycophilum]|uniref:Vegetative incompatibility HET-E-1-like protein n=1 Tax=Cladobotryum mycophilum TaxID=491253 RepID=A0ABR0SQW8_9HYPO
MERFLSLPRKIKGKLRERSLSRASRSPTPSVAARNKVESSYSDAPPPDPLRCEQLISSALPPSELSSQESQVPSQEPTSQPPSTQGSNLVSQEVLPEELPPQEFPSQEPSIHTVPSSPSYTSTLWSAAVGKVSDKAKKWIEEQGLESLGSTNSGQQLQALAQDLQEMVSKYEDDAMKIEIGGQRIIPREYLADGVAFLTMVGDAAMTFAPPQASGPWAVAKALLRIPVLKAEQMAAVVGTLQTFVRIIRRGQLYEQIHTSETTDEAAILNLHEALVGLYTAAIELLVRSYSLLEKGEVRKTLDIVFHPNRASGLISDLSKMEQRLSHEVSLCESSRHDKSTDQITKKLRDHLNELSAPLTRIDKGVVRLLEAINESQVEALLNFISSEKIGNRHADVCDLRLEGTGEWLLNHPSFRDWDCIPSSSTVLWLKGTVGTGKTCLTSRVIDATWRVLKDTSSHDEGFAYFYCTRSGNSMQDPLIALKSIVRQLSQKANDSYRIQTALRKRYELAQKEQRDFSYKDCEDLILESFNLYSKTTLILDALDESDTTTHNLAETIIGLMEKSIRPVKIFISSRPDREFMDVFEARSTIEIDSASQASDIEKYLNKHVYSSLWFERRDDKVKSLIKETFKDKSNGMFRWVHLQTQALKALTTNAAIETWTKNVPKDLKGAYDQLWERIEQSDPNDFELAERVIKWVMCSFVPHKNVILEAVRYAPEGRGVVSRAERQTLEQVLNLCQDLITINKNGDLVFPHASVAEYFETNRWALAECDLPASTVCLGLFMSPGLGFDDWINLEDDDENSYRSSHFRSRGSAYKDSSVPFYCYIMKSWHEHVSRYDKWLGTRHETLADVEMSTLLKSFLGSPDDSSPQFRKWVEKSNYDKPGSSNISLLSVCKIPIYYTVRDWWDSDYIWEAARKIDSTILIECLEWAIKQDHVKICEQLVKWVDDKDLLTKLLDRLYDVIRKDRANLAKVFIVKINWDLSSDGWSTVVAYTARYCPELLEWLLSEKLIEANMEYHLVGHVNTGGSLLNSAILGDKFVQTSELLIKAGVDVNSVIKTDRYESALIAAAASYERDSLQRVMFLVDHGADVNFIAESGWYGSALDAAIKYQRRDDSEVAFFLLNKVSDDHLTTTFDFGLHGSLLAAAAFSGEKELLRAMIGRVGQERALGTLHQSRHMDGLWNIYCDFERRKEVISFLREELPGVDDGLLKQIGFRPDEM